MKKYFFPLSFFLVIISAITINAQKNLTQTVYFKNGSIIKGTTEQDMTTGKIKITTYDGSIFVYNISEVDSIISTKTKLTNRLINYPYHQQGFWNVTEYTNSIGNTYGFDGVVVYGLSSIFGYKFSPQFTLGLGVAGELYYNGYALPIFLDGRYYPMVRRGSPFFGFQMGYSIAGLPLEVYPTYTPVYYKGGIYVSPLIGVRVYLSKRVALNFAFSYQFHQFSPPSINYSAYYSSSICLRVGVSF